MEKLEDFKDFVAEKLDEGKTIAWIGAISSVFILFGLAVSALVFCVSLMVAWPWVFVPFFIILIFVLPWIIMVRQYKKECAEYDE